MNRMMTAALAWLVWMAVILVSEPLYSKSAHVLIVADTADPVIGTGVDRDLKELERTFDDVNHLAERKLAFWKSMNSRKEIVSRRTVFARIRSISPARDDAFVFIWSGHGAHDQRGHYLQVPEGDDKRLYRDEILDEMKTRGCRLTVLVTASCNEYRDMPRIVPPDIALPRLDVTPRPTAFEELFLLPKGVVDINSATEGELSLVDRQLGSWFFILLEGYLRGEGRATWPILVRWLNEQIGECFDREFPNGFRHESTGKIYFAQTAKAWAYPKMPSRPSRSGLFVQNRQGRRGVQVTGVCDCDGYPGTQMGDFDGDGRRVRLERGDVIVAVNGRPVANKDEFWDLVKLSPRFLQIRIIDVRTDKERRLGGILKY